MKNVYKWRIVTNKYLYLTDENNAGPFIFNKITKERIYECSGTPQVDDYGVDEGKISQNVSEIRDAHVYETMFNNMVNLAMCDTDAQKLHFLTYDNYFNIDSDECVEEAVTPKCEGYEPIFNISAHTIDETEVSYTFFPERNEQDKTLRYRLDLGIPRGLTGEKGETGESGCQGAKGDDGKSAVIAGADATVNVLPPGLIPQAQVEVVPESATTEDENQYVFHFNFGLPKGVQGNPGPQGIRGANGKDAIITDASATIYPLEYGQQPQVSVSAITTPTQEENQTELCFHFDIPAGPQGEVGPAGAQSLIHEARVGRIDTLEPGSDATVTVEARPYEQSANSYDLVFNFGIPRGADGSSGGGGGGWTYNIDDPTFIEDAGISVPYGQFNTVYHPGDGEADVTLTIHYPSSWGQGGGGETDIKHRYEATKNGSDSLSEGVKDIVNGVAYPKAIASGARSHAEGIGFSANEMPNAIGIATHTEGKSTTAEGNYSHAEGENTRAVGKASHAEGIGVDGEYIDANMRINCDGELIIEKWDVPAGYDLSGITGATFTVKDLDKVNDDYSSAVTESTIFMIDSANTLSGEDNHFRFDSVTVNFTDTSGITHSNIPMHGNNGLFKANASYTDYSDGYYLRLFLTHGNTGAYGEGSHVEGGYNVANDDYSHAEGWSTIADGVASHAEGGATVTRGDYSHAGGYGTVADKDYMTAIGKFNATGETGTLFAVGDGADGNRSNVFSINGQTKKVTLSNNGGGIKLPSGGRSTLVWNTSGGTTDISGGIGGGGRAIQVNSSEILSSGSRTSLNLIGGTAISISGTTGGTVTITSTAVPIGSIQMYAGSSSPTGWLLCNGDAVSRTTYSDLFNIIGTTYGVGDGSTTFNLPNLQQKFPLGALAGGTIGNYFDTSTTSWQSWGTDLGSTGGEDTTKLYASNLPNHKHRITTWATSSGTEDSVEAEASGGTRASAKTDDTIYTSGDLKVVDGTPGSRESKRKNLNNTPLFLAINFIIKY